MKKLICLAGPADLFLQRESGSESRNKSCYTGPQFSHQGPFLRLDPVLPSAKVNIFGQKIILILKKYSERNTSIKYFQVMFTFCNRL